MNEDIRDIIKAINEANKIDEQKIIDDLIADVSARRSRLFDIVRIDLSIDRSTNPLEISGAGTVLIAFRATSSATSCAVTFETEESDSNRRYTLVQGRRLKFPYTKFYVYHAAQAAGTFMELIRARSLPSLTLGVEDDSSDNASASLETALANSSTYTTAQVTVDATADVIKAANTSRKRITVRNHDGATNLFIGLTAGVLSTTGFLIPPGGSMTLQTTAAIYGITAAGSITVSYLEE